MSALANQRLVKNYRCAKYLALHKCAIGLAADLALANARIRALEEELAGYKIAVATLIAQKEEKTK